MENGLIYRDDEMVPPSNALVPYEDKQITALGNLHVAQVSDTLHRVKKFKVNLIGGTSREVTYPEYDHIAKAITSSNAPRFIKFKNGDFIAVNQIVSIKADEVIIDTRREEM